MNAPCHFPSASHRPPAGSGLGGWLRRTCLLWLVACLWVLGSPALTHAVPMTPEAHPGGQSTRDHLLYWRDDSGTASFEDIRQPEGEPRFQRPDRPPRASGDRAVHWLQLQIRQPRPGGDWVLALPSTSAREVTFWGPFDAQGRPLAPPHRTGLSQTYDSRPLGSERYVQRLELPEPGTYTVYWRVASDIASHLEPTLWETSEYLYWRGHKRLFDGLCYGILLALLIYNLALTAVFKDRTYGLYVLSCGFALLTLATFNGHTAHYLWPEHPWWIEHSYTLFPALWLSCNALFARHFLNTRALAPRLDWVILGLLWIACLGLGFSVTGQASWAQRVNEAVSFAGVWLITGTALWAWRRGYRPALWYLAGQLALFAAVVALVLVNWNLLDSPWISANALQTGVALELAGFAVALGVRIRLLQRQQAELSVRATHLAQQVTTDPLTGVANRAGLVQAAAEALQAHRPCAVLLLDLDHFKAINDTHGHDAGDLVLATVAQRLASELRKSDTVARLGGDEFVVLLQYPSQQPELMLTIRRLCDRMNRPVPYGPHALQVRASVGVALSPQDGTELNQLLKAADQAMYRAKRQQDGLAFYAPSTDTRAQGGEASQFGTLG